MAREPFTLADLQALCLATQADGRAELYVGPEDYAAARSLIPREHRIRQSGRPGAHFLTAFCVVAPTETFH